MRTALDKGLRLRQKHVYVAYFKENIVFCINIECIFNRRIVIVTDSVRRDCPSHTEKSYSDNMILRAIEDLLWL